jgi:medium-chain acyl-[acyl-carrier-protein] hydrolase
MVNQANTKPVGPPPWFKAQPGSTAPMRLFCFPYAGGGSAIFRQWSRGFVRFPVEVVPALLPGRESRVREPGYTHIDKYIEALAREISAYLDKPFVFFGHSMGAIIAFELARRLRDERGLEPKHLFISGRRPPRIPRRDPYVHDLPEAELIAEIARMNGTPKEVLEHTELMELMIPLLRTDFAVCHSYTYAPGEPLRCPITVLGGTRDEEAPPHEFDLWREETTGDFNVHLLEGDHFFINQPPLQNEVARIITTALQR